MKIKEIRDYTGLSQVEFGIKYKIPLRSIQNWEYERRTPPAYVIYMLERLVKIDYNAK